MNTDITSTSTGASVVPDRQLIRAAHGTEALHNLVRAFGANQRAQEEAQRLLDRAFRRGEAKANPAEVAAADKACAAANAAEQALHSLWRGMGYQDCPTRNIGEAIEWSF